MYLSGRFISYPERERERETHKHSYYKIWGNAEVLDLGLNLRMFKKQYQKLIRKC